jgi:hypothetical protein
VVPFRDVTLTVETAEPRRIGKVIATRAREAESALEEMATSDAD